MTSEVGLSQPNMENHPDESANHWRELFLQQNQNFRELVEALKQDKSDIVLPEFDPNNKNSNAKAWITTADLCIRGKQIDTSNLMIVLSRALKGEASIWLTQVSFPDMKWEDFQRAFIARFDATETPSSSLIRMLESKPRENESFESYAVTCLTNLLSQWRDLTKEEIAVSLTMAHLSKFVPRIRQVAFTTEVRTRIQMQQELSAIQYEPERKKFRPSTPPQSSKCFVCGKDGHKVATCPERQSKQRHNNAFAVNQQPTTSSRIVCFKCNQIGHIASRCPSLESSRNDRISSQGEKRINLCTVDPPAGTLTHGGEYYRYQYDSGAECSLAKESIAENFKGTRYFNIVSLIGISLNSIQCSIQVKCEVTINGNDLEVLLHIVPDRLLPSDIVIGREVLSLGFTVFMTASEFSLNKLNNTSRECRVLNIFANINTEIREIETKSELMKILNEYADYFVESMPTTRVKTGELEIRLIDSNKVVQRRPYRLSFEERAEMRKKVSELLNANIIRPSMSPFASPALLVKKHDGSHRMCIDYRELNNNTVPDRYPIPLISDQIPRLSGAKCFTQLDCASGFHLIPVNENSIERTAFITSDGQFEYLTMPFGLRNAISVFQRAIVKALGDLVYDYVIIYVDDILIISNSVEQGLDRLRIVLDKLTKAGFSLNIKKCSFLRSKVSFLGFEIENGEIKPNQRKIEALSALPPPNTVTQLRQFIGLASYFRQFVGTFSRIIAPLHKMTSLTGKLIWKPEHEKIRQQIISTITNDPLLVIFKPDLPIELHTDASSEGYGAILFHIVEDKKRVVAYFSKRTSPAEANYHSFELETLAVVNAVKHFRSYLHGRKFTVVTDCNSLKDAHKKKDLSPRIQRWLVYLQSFDFNIIYREGKRMLHVDFLSRNLLPETNLIRKEVVQKFVNILEITNEWLLAEQKRDEEILKIITELDNDQLKEDVAKTYVFRSGVLYREIQRYGNTRCLPYLPRSLRWSVINNFHESLMHLGFEKTLEKVYQCYWFPGMTRFVKNFVNNCITCKLSKKNSGKKQIELHSIPKIAIPWHTVHMDATGKLSGKNDQKEYVFVLIDAFTKFVLLFHSTKIDSVSSIAAVSQSAAIFGAPARIIADQGRCFTSREFCEFCRSKNISLHLVATGAARANGQVERVMSVLKAMLTAVEVGKDRSWQEALGDVQIALNSSINHVTKVSPLELLIGKVARPLSLMCSDRDMEVDLLDIRKNAVENIEKSSQYDKERYDAKGTKPKKFNIGDFVLLENEERHQAKLDAKFKGPFEIITVLENDRYELKALNSRRTYKYAHDRLRAMPNN